MRRLSGPASLLSAVMCVLVPYRAMADGSARATPAPRVWVHVDGPAAAELQQASGDGHWTTVCTGPCEAPLPLGAEYRVDGQGIQTSNSFRLTGTAEQHVRLTVKPGSSTFHAVGLALVPIGLVTVLLGLLADFRAGFDSGFGGSEGPADPHPDMTPGNVTMGVGAAVAVLGMVVMAVNTTRAVFPDAPSPDPSSSEPAQAMEGDPTRIVPTWRAAERAPIAPPPMLGVPLWTGRF
jgi:hypothetical protein